MYTKLIKASVLALSMGLVGGCADMTQLEEAKAASAAAMAKATDAYNLAQNAHTVASEASHAAEQATKSAEAALECCNENSRKLDQMFEKAMKK
ncbi:MAG: hypothetical protein HW411_992 [Gammaproteobacteria bacterium]|nr:hypothetical protein [Gammaproteobacteria bacterium]